MKGRPRASVLISAQVTISQFMRFLSLSLSLSLSEKKKKTLNKKREREERGRQVGRKGLEQETTRHRERGRETRERRAGGAQGGWQKAHMGWGGHHTMSCPKY